MQNSKIVAIIKWGRRCRNRVVLYVIRYRMKRMFLKAMNKRRELPVMEQAEHALLAAMLLDLMLGFTSPEYKLTGTGKGESVRY